MTSVRSETSGYLLEILRAVIDGRKAPPPPEGTDIGEVFSLAYEHRLAAMAYCGLYPDVIGEKQLEPFRRANRAALMHAVLAESEFGRITAALEREGVDYCPLKGWFTRELYPEPSMRTMSDIDILIPKEASAKAKAIMEGMGYGCVRYMLDDDDKYKRPGLLIEFHRELDSDGLGDPGFYRDPWRLTEKVTEHGRRLAPSDEYLYTVAHTLKHFMSSGTGLRSLLDIYLYMTKAPLDRDYIDNTAQKMGMSRFLSSMENAARAAFGGETPDPDTAQILDFIIESGVIGTRENLNTANMMHSGRGMSGGTKATYLKKLIFPSAKGMRLRYPVLRDKPWLLPAMHVRRWFELAFTKPERRKEALERYAALELSDAERLRRIHEIAGVGE